MNYNRLYAEREKEEKGKLKSDRIDQINKKINEMDIWQLEFFYGIIMEHKKVYEVIKLLQIQ